MFKPDPKTKQSTDTLAAYRPQIESLGLNYEHISRQHQLLMQALATGALPFFQVLDTCRLDNGGILKPDAFTTLRALTTKARAQKSSGYIAFIPAAGAASRYSAPLASLLESLDDETTNPHHLQKQKESLRRLGDSGALKWRLPLNVARLIENPELLAQLSKKDVEQLKNELNLPKALFPCVEEHLSFLCMKDIEHSALPSIKAQIFVTPSNMAEVFEQELNRSRADHKLNAKLITGFLEQGPSLSTLRFQRDGMPVEDCSTQIDASTSSTHGKAQTLSPVPAGHGALATLIPQAKGFSPSAHSLFIRNIDNVMGCKTEAIQATERFLATHELILHHVRAIRTSLLDHDAAAAAAVADQLLPELRYFELSPEQAKQLNTASNLSLRSLAELQMRLFHSNTSPLDLPRLKELYARPVNTLGQVPNTGKDVGGTPAFIATKAGREKVCIEVPHVSEADKLKFLMNPNKATHFNPVFAAAEIIDDPNYYVRNNHDFWLLAEKNYRAQSVIYFETVLYELLGNSRLANCSFIEVPRIVFNPHKTLDDAQGRSCKTWL